jgi:hypothetical protein
MATSLKMYTVATIASVAAVASLGFFLYDLLVRKRLEPSGLVGTGACVAVAIANLWYVRGLRRAQK